MSNMKHSDITEECGNLEKIEKSINNPKYLHLMNIDGKKPGPIMTICYIIKSIKKINVSYYKLLDKSFDTWKKDYKSIPPYVDNIFLVSFGVAIRNLSDRYDRKLGNSIALKRASEISKNGNNLICIDITNEPAPVIISPKRIIINEIVNTVFSSIEKEGYSCIEIFNMKEYNGCNPGYKCYKFIDVVRRYTKKDPPSPPQIKESYDL
jgi:hypothetical protein